MPLTTERMALLGAMGLGIAVLAADRMYFSGGPKPAEAGIADSGMLARFPEEALSGAGKGGGDRPSLARRLSDYAEAASLAPDLVRDAFVPSTAWISSPQHATSDNPSAREARDPREVYLQKHRLSAVMGGGAAAIAIVDGRPIRIGEEHDGFTLIEVTQRSAVFGSPSGRVELRLAP